MILYSPRGFLPNRRMLPIAALVAFAAPQARAQDAALRIGIAWLDSAAGCVAISNAALAAGTPLTFVRVPVSGMGELAVAVTGETLAAAALTAPGCASIHGGSPNDHLYTIRLAQGSDRGAYFALLTPRQSVTLRGPSATVRFPPDSSNRERVPPCASHSTCSSRIWPLARPWRRDHDRCDGTTMRRRPLDRHPAHRAT